MKNFAIIPILPFLNNPKDLDPSCKMDLDLWDLSCKRGLDLWIVLEGKKLCLITKEIRY